MKHKTLNAIAGFVAGIFAIPLAIVVCPIIIAWFLYNETETEED